MMITILDASGTITGDYSLRLGIAYDALTDTDGIVLVGSNADPTLRGVR